MVQHVKRIAGPRSWPVFRKQNTWLTAPKSGHSMEDSVPLNVVFKDMLKLAKTTKETRYIIFHKGVLLNGNKVSSEKTGMGIFDVLTLPEVKESCMMLLNNRGKLTIKKLSEKDSDKRISKVIGKTYLSGKRIQVNFMGGVNLIVKKDDFSVGDSAVVSVKDKKVVEILKLDKGALVYLLTGKNISHIAKVEKVDGSELVCKHEDTEFKINKDDVVVVGKDKPYLEM